LRPRHRCSCKQAPKLSHLASFSAAPQQSRHTPSPPDILALTKHACVAPSMLQRNRLTTSLQTHWLDVQCIYRAGKKPTCLAARYIAPVHVNGGSKHSDRRRVQSSCSKRPCTSLKRTSHCRFDVGQGDGSGGLTLHVPHRSFTNVVIDW
jgi:hypothetical protein